MTCKDFLTTVIDYTSSSAKRKFKEAMCSSNEEYISLGFEGQEDVIKVTDKTDKGELALVDFLNDGLKGCSRDNLYEFIWSKTWPGHSNYMDLVDGDIYLVKRETNTPIMYFDLKVAESKDYDTVSGMYLGGNISYSSMEKFPSSNHMYILSNYDGSIMLLMNGVPIRKLLKENNIQPRQSNWNKNKPYYTIVQHIKQVCTLNKNVWIIRNEHSESITCFK